MNDTEKRLLTWEMGLVLAKELRRERGAGEHAIDLLQKALTQSEAEIDRLREENRLIKEALLSFNENFETFKKQGEVK